MHERSAPIDAAAESAVELPPTGHVAHGSLDSLACLLDRVDIQPRPRDAFSAHAEDDHAISRRLPSVWDPRQRHSLQTQSPATAVATRSAWKSGTLVNTSDQLART